MTVSDEQIKELEKSIGKWPDFPIPGIVFRDVLPIFRNPRTLKIAVEWLKDQVPPTCNVIVSPESRGFLFGCPVAYGLDLPFVPARKPGKIPGPLVTESYALEYGEATLCVQKDAIKEDDQVFIVDDIYATGGTIAAIHAIVKKMGATVVGAACLIDIQGIPKLPDLQVKTLFGFVE